MEKHKNFLSENRSFFILLLDSAYLLTEVFLSFPFCRSDSLTKNVEQKKPTPKDGIGFDFIALCSD